MRSIIPARLVVAVVAAMLVPGLAPAAAAETTSVEITGAFRVGNHVLADGMLALGSDATGPVQIADDPQGDAAPPGVGLDYGKVTVTPDLGAQQLTYSIATFDMLPVPGMPGAPAFGYTIPIAVDADASRGFFLAAGNAGAHWPPSATTFFSLCESVSGSYSCPRLLQGSWANNRITLTVPFSAIAVKPGSVVEPSGGLACPGVCNTVWAGLLFNNNGGDSGPADAFNVAGGVRLGIGTASTPDASVSATVPATVGADGGWSGALPAPTKAGEYKLVAKSCWGTVDAPTCATASMPFTV